MEPVDRKEGDRIDGENYIGVFFASAIGKTFCKRIAEQEFMRLGRLQKEETAHWNVLQTSHTKGRVKTMTGKLITLTTTAMAYGDFHRRLELQRDIASKRLSDAMLHTACGVLIARDIQSGLIDLEGESLLNPSNAEYFFAPSNLLFEVVKRRVEVSGRKGSIIIPKAKPADLTINGIGSYSYGR